MAKAAEITTDPGELPAVAKAMEEKGYEILSDDLPWSLMTTTRLLTDPDQLKGNGQAAGLWRTTTMSRTSGTARRMKRPAGTACALLL